MLITRTSLLTGVTRSREIDVTAEQWARWKEGELIQDAMPHLSVEDREFLLSGSTPDEWGAVFHDACAYDLET